MASPLCSWLQAVGEMLWTVIINNLVAGNRTITCYAPPAAEQTVSGPHTSHLPHSRCPRGH
jgi:hypothetical protein